MGNPFRSNDSRDELTQPEQTGKVFARRRLDPVKLLRLHRLTKLRIVRLQIHIAEVRGEAEIANRVVVIDIDTIAACCATPHPTSSVVRPRNGKQAIQAILLLVEPVDTAPRPDKQVVAIGKHSVLMSGPAESALLLAFKVCHQG